LNNTTAGDHEDTEISNIKTISYNVCKHQIFVCIIPPGAWKDALGAIFESGGLDGVKKRRLCC